MLERKALQALAIAVAGIAVLAWGQHGYRQRDKVVAWAKLQCAVAGADYVPAPKSKAKPGAACGEAIDGLARFKADTTAATNQTLAEILADQAQRNERALTQARAAAAEARAAAQVMDAANAQVPPDDRVGRDWFDALNRSGGLRDPAS